MIEQIKQTTPQTQPKIYEIATQSCIICNSCRYCEGLCAVFPAMEKYREFSPNDIEYLANLCHQCSECFYDCQYAPPHEFNVSIPAQFAHIRKESYKRYAFPSFLGRVFEANALLSTLILVIVLFVGFVVARFLGDSKAPQVHDGNFYYVIPYNYMVSVFSGVAILVIIALVFGIIRYIRAIKIPKISLSILKKTLQDSLQLKYLGGHKNEGCTYPNSDRSNIRKFFHHFTAYGFLLCFIATALAAFYEHFLHIHAPYSLGQLPKIFGLVGGIFLCIGSFGLTMLKFKAQKDIKDEASIGLDYVFLCMLFIVSLSGLCLMAFKASVFLSPLLWFHLSCVLVFFILLPYSKFVHIFYRFFALLKYNAEDV